MKILAVSDVELPQMQNVKYLTDKFGDSSVLISCGDMPASYLDFISTALNLPLFYVRGNHDTAYVPPNPGGQDLHLKVLRFQGVTMAGLEGSIRYNDGAIQYSQADMLRMVLGMMPRMLLMRKRYGYGVDVMVTHSPPEGIHDIPEDYAHRGFKALCYLMVWARPRYLLHGHVDTWDRRRQRETQFAYTTVLNVNPYMALEL